MRAFFDNIKNNTLIKLASLNSISVIIRIVSGFITSKVIAIYVGAEGLALIGNFRNFVTSSQSLSLLGIQNGLIKYVAESKRQPKKMIQVVSTTSLLIVFATFLVGLIIFFLADYISLKLFDTNTYSYILKLFALVLPFQSLNKLIISVINGFSKFKTIIKLNIIGQILGALVTVVLIYLEKEKGALIAVAIVESVLVVFTGYIAVKYRFFSRLYNKNSFQLSFAKKMASYSGMALFSAITFPFLMVFIRNYITDNVGLREAGFWEAMNRISEYYLMFVNSLIAIYVLPKFSEIKTSQAFRSEILSFYKTLLPIFGLGLISVYFLRYFIINLILTEEFLLVSNLFVWQLLGDFIKVVSLVIAYQLIAKRMFWQYILSEVLSMASLYIGSVLLIGKYGLVGANMAHLVNYIVYLIVVLIIFRKSLFFTTNKKYTK